MSSHAKQHTSFPTIVQQSDLESRIHDIYAIAAQLDRIRDSFLSGSSCSNLLRDLHVHFVLDIGLSSTLSSRFSSLDASRPWIAYWCSHASALLGMYLCEDKFPEDNDKWKEKMTTEVVNTLCRTRERIIGTLQSLQNVYEGGFGGQRFHSSHVASSYAAALALVECADAGVLCDTPYYGIDRDQLYAFLLRMKEPDGSFHLHLDGEIDVRGSYCALTIAFLFDLLTPELTENCAQFIQRCQTYEGGFSAVPGAEAHGGYGLCSIAALIILDSLHMVDLDRLLYWSVHRQMSVEGGFQGRTNKLVDSCYSTWVGAMFNILGNHFVNEDSKLIDDSILDRGGDLLYAQLDLQKYILLCCQNKDTGGLRDKPGVTQDFYHTCYALNGLSCAQYGRNGSSICVFGQESNLLEITNPVFGVTEKALRIWMRAHNRETELDRIYSSSLSKS